MENTNVVESGALPASQLNLNGVFSIPAVRQVVLLLGIAAAVAAGLAIALWSQSPGYVQLYGGMDAAESAEVADALRASGIDYKLDPNGSIQVPESSLHGARLELASQGLPESISTGMESIREQSSFGTSQFMESARYQYALESELVRTISSLGSVRDARVHLAMPRQTSFIRDQRRASASVLLHLYRGRVLEDDQAAAIVNLVAASVPDLAPDNVTVVDQYGRLLSAAGEDSIDAQAASRLKYTRRLEDTYRQRIEALLTPLVGPGRVRAQVVADVDFTVVEETRESYDPASTVVRSEQLTETRQSGSAAAVAGVPGALSNQPPEAGGETEAAETVASEPVRSSRDSIRNYEVDRTISRTRPQPGTIRRLSVAVLVDDGVAADPGAEAGANTALADEDIARYTALVREAVGFDEARGDTVVVVNEAFRDVDEAAEIAAPAIWERPVVRDVSKQVLGAALVLAIAFGVVRPMLRGILSGGSTVNAAYLGSTAGAAPAGAQLGAGSVALAGPKYEEKVAAAKNITGHDPARVAQVVKRWVTTDE